MVAAVAAVAVAGTSYLNPAATCSLLALSYCPSNARTSDWSRQRSAALARLVAVLLAGPALGKDATVSLEHWQLV